MKIKIGKSNRKKFKADLGFDVSTTTSFGHCQPLMCKEMVPDSEFNVEVDSFVRLAPMVSPTFGRLKYKVWHNFVPIGDIWKPFENMLAGREYETFAEGSMIPVGVPQIKVSQLSKYFYTMDFYGTTYQATTGMTSGATTALTHNGIVKLGAVLETPSGQTYFNGSWVAANTRPWYNSGLYREWYGQGGTTTSASTYSAAYRWGAFGTGPNAQLHIGDDFKVPFDNCDMLWIEGSQSGATYPMFAQRLTDRQRRLRKVLLGLGYQLDVTNDEVVSLLPLIAYYKAWFTTLFPQRYKTWTDTNAYKLMNTLEVQGQYVVSNNGDAYPYFEEFMNDLCDTYYYDDADYVTAQLLDPNQSPASISLKYVDATGEISNQPTIDATDQSNATIQNTNGSYFDDTAIRLLKILTKFVNKNNVIGGKISEYLRAHYNADVVNNLLQNYFIGGDSTDIVISDVMSNAQTEGSPVGDYAGYGVGYKDGTNYHFKSDTFGYWITFSALVPRAKFFQGIDPTLKHIDRFTFYAPEFDALGYMMTSKSCVFNREGLGAVGLATSANTLNTQFGLIPRYSEYKICSKNVVNGDMSLPSTRDTLNQYTVDKMLTPSTVYYDGFDESTKVYSNVHLVQYPTDNLFAGIEYREIGKDGQKGNFDRVFYNSESPLDAAGGKRTGLFDSDFLAPIYRAYSKPNDNFICHHIINVDAKLPMIPISESWYTDGEDENNIGVDQV